MGTVQFKPAERKQLKLKLGITGGAGSGKTVSALEIASGMGGRIAVIDTENRSASIYTDRYKFDVLELEPPFTVDRYVDAMRGAVEAGYDVLIVDSASHQWAGEGGILDKKQKMDKRGGNSFTNWADMTTEHNTFLEFILRAPIHMIITLRSKVEWVIEQNEKGKSVPRKVGMAPITRDGLDFELTAVLDMDLTHHAASSKDRTGLFDGQIFQPSRKTGQQLIAWLNAGKSPSPPTPPPPREAVATGQGATETRVKPMPPVDPEEGEKGITREQWAKVTDAMFQAGDLAALAATYKATVRMHENEGTEAQMKVLASYKDQLKIHAEGK